MADRTIVLATNKRHAVRGLTVTNSQEFSAFHEENDDLTYIVDMSSYLDGATISSVTRTPTGVTVSNTSNTTTRITQRLKGFGYVDFKVTTSSGDVEEFRVVIQQRGSSRLQQIAQVPDPMPVAYTEARDPTNADDTIDGYVAGNVWINTLTNNVFDCISNAQGAAIWRCRARVLGSSAVSASVTGTTSETTLATIAIPVLGANDTLRISTLWSYTNSANNKTFRADLGGTDFLAVVQTASAVFKDTREIRNVNSQSVQKSWPASAAGANNTGSAITTGAVNTDIATTLTLTAQLALGSETATLESYVVELLRPDIT